VKPYNVPSISSKTLSKPMAFKYRAVVFGFLWRGDAGSVNLLLIVQFDLANLVSVDLMR